MLSVIIPCYNQGRFLIDALESLATQDVLPDEVVVVNDGSTDPQTIQLCERLPNYLYPFPLKVVSQPNRGLPSARNFGIRESRGDIILPLDSDDKLLDQAILEYHQFMKEHPEVDVCYPDTKCFGNDEFIFLGENFNAWRLVQNNIMVCSSAIRRRVFQAGYWYSEEMSQGYEDWEFWIRTCALGPFKAAPLKKLVFAYRRWAFSMVAATDAALQTGRIRSLHRDQKIWSRAIGRDLRTRYAPSHRLIVADGTRFDIVFDDVAVLQESRLREFLETDLVSRFLWFGPIRPAAVTNLQIILNEVARQTLHHVYVFVDQDTTKVYGIVIDRQAHFQMGPTKKNQAGLPVEQVTAITTQGKKFPWPVSVQVQKDQRFLERIFDVQVPDLDWDQLAPKNLSHDPRIAGDLWYYFRRTLQPPIPFLKQPSQRVLILAMPYLVYGGTEFAVRILLEEGELRRQFDKVLIITFEQANHEAHALFEPLVDGICHLGWLEDHRKKEIALGWLESLEPADLLIVNSRHAYEMIPEIRKAKLNIQITAQVHGFDYNATTQSRSGGYPELLASHYATLIDRVSSIAAEQTAQLIDRLYFPACKIKTVHLGVDLEKFSPSVGSGLPRKRQILWCGRLAWEKDPLLGLEVAAHFLENYPAARFLFVGDGPLRHQFGSKLADLTNGSNIEWIPYSDQVHQLLKTSGCLFMTSVYEGIPMVFMEAVSAAVPVVMCLAKTYVPEVAEHGRIFPIKCRTDVEEYAARLEEALTTGTLAPDPYFCQHRYARETMDWLFASATPAQDHLSAFFGQARAA